MNQTIKTHLDAIADQLKGTKHSFLFLMADGDQQHAVKNCDPKNQAALMVNYIESTPDIDEAFTNCVMQLQEAYDGKKSFQERLSDKIEEKGITVLDEVELPKETKGNE